MTTNVTGWYDVTAYGATGNGVTDDTAGCQSAITTCINNGGGVVYLPPGQYLTSTALTVNTSSAHVPVYMQGAASSGGENVNGTGGTTLMLSQNPNTASSSVYGVYALGGGTGSPSIFRMTDITMVTTVECTVTTTEFDMIYCKDMVNTYFERIQMFENHNSAGSVIVPTVANTGLHIINAFGAWVDQCELLGNMNALWMDSTQQLFVTNTFASSFTANTNSVCIRVDDYTNHNGSGTINMTNVATFGGGYGLYGLTYSNNDVNPAFFYANDLQINNPSQGGIYMNSGAGVWLDYGWVSLEHPTNGVAHGIELDTNFEGTFYMVNSTVQSPTGHGVYAKGGTGYAIVASSFGGCSRGNTNTYDDIHIGSATSNISITGNHFDVDVAQGINGARSAIYCEAGSGPNNITGNMFPNGGYHTDTVIDYAGATGGANTNFNLAYEGWNTITLDSGWTASSGAVTKPQWRTLPDGNLQLRGRASANFTGSKTLNNSNPLPTGAAPAYTCDFYSSDVVGNRCHISISNTGVITAFVPAGGSGTWYAEINGMIPLE